LLVISWILAFAERFAALYGVLEKQLRRENFEPANAPAPGDDRTRRRLDEIAARDRGNVTVFPEYSPFIGFGPAVQTWSIVLNTATAAVGRTVDPFEVGDLHRHVAADLQALGLPGVSIEDRLFVNGLDLRHDIDPAVTRQILPDELRAPLAQIDQRLIDELRTDAKGRSRPYLMVRITGWSGELTLTVFLRFALLRDRDLLFVESSYSLLPPVKDRYREADRLTPVPTLRQLAKLAGRSAALVPGQLLRCLPRTVAVAAGPIAGYFKARRDERQITQDRSFNYGAVLAPRELVHDNKFDRYFQQLDKEMYAKIAERRILDSIREFMERHGIDLADFADRQTTILNHGVFATGNAKVDVGAFASGTMAKALSKIGLEKK
jgi:hypothetical protein